MITIEGAQAVARFSQFDLADYATFLKLKRTVPAPEMDLKYDWRSDSYTVKMPSRYAAALGCDASAVSSHAALPLAAFLFDYQRWFMKLALERKRYALFWDCGLGKTPMALEFCRQAMTLTGKRAMVCTFNLIIGEFLEQAERFYGDGLLESRVTPTTSLRGSEHSWTDGDTRQMLPHSSGPANAEAVAKNEGINRQGAERRGIQANNLPIEVLETRKDIKLWCVGAGSGLAIMNTEKFMDKKEGLIPELRQLGCFALDESSILKTGGGTAKWNIIKSTKGIEYKLSGSATPAPNEAMEYASQASFLETITNDGEIIWTYFTKDKAGNWYIKPHAMEAFYRFLAGWSNYMRTPAAYGFKDNIRPVPEPEFIVHQVQATPEQMQEAQRYRFEIGAGLIGDQRLGVKERMKLSQIAKGFVYE
jgi:hypothetical protein